MSRYEDHRNGRTTERLVADALWSNRHGLKVHHDYGKETQTTTIEVNAGLKLVIAMQCNDGLLRHIVVETSGHRQFLHKYSGRSGEGVMLVADAWRAAQASRMLRSMGEDDGIEGDRIEMAPLRIFERLGMDLEPRRLPAYQELMARLDAAASNILAEFPPDVDSSHVDMGGGVKAFRCYSQGVLLHPDHGCTSHYGPGDHYPLLAATFERLREDSLLIAVSRKAPLPPPVVPALGNAHATRMIQLCTEAVRLNPMLADSKGTLLAPLIRTHIPDLVRIHRDAARNAHPSELKAIDDEFEDGMAVVCRAMDEGLTLLQKETRDESRDELRRQIAFLNSRHPDDRALGVAA